MQSNIGKAQTNRPPQSNSLLSKPPDALKKMPVSSQAKIPDKDISKEKLLLETLQQIEDLKLSLAAKSKEADRFRRGNEELRGENALLKE